jgi:hypothetical protein
MNSRTFYGDLSSQLLVFLVHSMFFTYFVMTESLCDAAFIDSQRIYRLKLNFVKFSLVLLTQKISKLKYRVSSAIREHVCYCHIFKS